MAPASAAYFQWVNAHGGVHGRRIIYRYLNDHGNPRLAPSIAHRLIQQDNVLAIFNPAGDAANQAAVRFLNAARVPDAFTASGCACWDDPTVLPETFGWQLDYVREGKILGAYIASQERAQKIGLIFSPGLPGREGITGLRYQVPRAQIAATLSASLGTGPRRWAATLKASHATVVAAFTTPAVTARLLTAMNRLSYHPQLIAASDSADPAVLIPLLTRALGTAAAATAAAQGIITDVALPLPSATSNWTRLFRKIHDRYIPRLPFNSEVISGMAAAYTFTEALQRAGANPTRQSLAAAIAAGLPQGPALAPLGYSALSHAGLTGASMAAVRNGSLSAFTAAMATNATPAGPVSPVGAQPSAPATGIPQQ